MAGIVTMPESVVVGPVTYRITDRDDDWREAQLHGQGKRDRCWGLTWEDRALILVNVHDEQKRRETVLHEVMHAVAATVGAGSKKKHTEERWISMFSPLLLDTLQRNPDLIAWLLDTPTSTRS